MDYNNTLSEPQSKKAQGRISGGSDVFKVSVESNAQKTHEGQMNATSGKNSLKAGLKSFIQGDTLKKKKP